MTSLPVRGNRVVMEKRNRDLLLRIGATTGLLALALGYSPDPILARSREKTYSSWSDYGGSPDSMGILRPSRLTRQM